MTEERIEELKNALTIVVDSEEIAEECENANYHSLVDFLQEILTQLERGEAIGYAAYGDVDDEDE